MRSNIARWRCSTIAGPACVDRLNPVTSTFAWNKNSSRSRMVKSACTERVLRSSQAIRSSRIAWHDSVAVVRDLRRRHVATYPSTAAVCRQFSVEGAVPIFTCDPPQESPKVIGTALSLT